MTTQHPIRETTHMLVQHAAEAFNARVSAIAAAAVRDGEAPAGATLIITSNPPHWVVETPDIQPVPQPASEAAS